MSKIGNLKLWDGSVGEGWVLTVKPLEGLAVKGAYIGCSIAVNGVCLTATEFDDTKFSVGISPETLRLTNMSLLKKGDRVNVERSMTADQRNSGHYVQGHVDGMGEIVKKHREGDSLWIQIKVAPELLDLIVHKGYIAVDGTSLTVCTVNREEGWFNLMLVQHTQQIIIMPHKQLGDKVNLEVDVAGKYAAAASKRLEEKLTKLEQRVTYTTMAFGAAAILAFAVMSTRK